MQHISSSVQGSGDDSRHLEQIARWNRRLLLTALVVLIAFTNLLFLKRAEPFTQAMIAGEGTLLSNTWP